MARANDGGEESVSPGARMESLATYRAKRNAARTPEPMGHPSGVPTRAKRSGALFVIQEHHARARHFDFRLEHDGVLVSWALPKGLPESGAANHLAVHTEDHPIEYADFEGEIPKGEYGGGTVRIWDRGDYDLEKWRVDEIIVVLHGQRASGRYVLFSTKGKNWIIHKMDDPPKRLSAAPADIEPMLALAGPLPDDDGSWAYEFKWDGVRAIVTVDHEHVRARSRNGKDLASDFPELEELGAALRGHTAVFDGEIVAFDDVGRPNFGRLQRRLHLGSPARVARTASEVPAHFLVFDLLGFDGDSLLELTYDERRDRLDSLALNGESFATPPSFRDRAGIDVLDAARAGGLEGVVAKRRRAPYRPGSRRGEWIKVKNFRTQEVVIGGWTAGKGERTGSLGALLLGLPGSGGLDYVGKVGTGFDEASRKELLKLLKALIGPSPFARPIPGMDRADPTYVRGALVGEVRYGEWTRDRHLRHPVWRGLRPDKDPAAVVLEP